MSDFINTIDALGEDVVIDSIINRTIKEFKDNVITSVGDYAFFCCYMSKVVLPKVQAVGRGAFNYASFTIADFTNVSYMDLAAFNSATFTAFIIRNTAVPTIKGTTFQYASAQHGTGYFYVPAALVDSYKAATNWATYADQFRAIEDYTVDGTITGELDETKI